VGAPNIKKKMGVPLVLRAFPHQNLIMKEIKILRVDFADKNMCIVVPGVEPEHDLLAVLDGGEAVGEISARAAGVYLLVGLFRLFDKILFGFVHGFPPAF
jgi:hypothetical protein